MVLKMSIIGHMVTLVALLTGLQCKVHAEKIESEADIVESMESAFRAERSLYPENAFTAGELTPVWLAYEKHDTMVYDRLEAGIVKKALDYFKSKKFHGLPRVRRNIDKYIHLVEESHLIPNFNRSKRDENEQEEFYYPSLLVVMEHQNNWPSNKQDQDKLIFEKILYALTYWDAVNIQLRRIRHPGVRVRIAGIVIGRDKNATPETLKKQTVFGIRLYETLGNSLTYWQGLRHTNSDFREGTFNVVATMIDTGTLIGTGSGFSVPSPVCGFYHYQGDKLVKLTGLIVYDNQDFGYVQQAVGEICNIMGRQKSGRGASADATWLSDSDLEDIRSALKWATCWKKPNEVHPPGKPVETLLIQDIMRH